MTRKVSHILVIVKVEGKCNFQFSFMPFERDNFRQMEKVANVEAKFFKKIPISQTQNNNLSKTIANSKKTFFSLQFKHHLIKKLSTIVFIPTTAIIYPNTLPQTNSRIENCPSETFQL